jgi:hypothetical protein
MWSWFVVWIHHWVHTPDFFILDIFCTKHNLSSAVRTLRTISISYMQLGLFFSGTKAICPLGITGSTTHALCIEYGLKHARRCKLLFAASSSRISGAQWHVWYVNLQTIWNNTRGSVGSRLRTTVFKYDIEFFDMYMAVKVYSFH